MAITASVQPDWIGPDRICQIWLPATVAVRFCFCFVFVFKEGMDHTEQNRPGSDVDGLARVWPNTSGLEASRCAGIIGPSFWQDAIGPLPVSHFTRGSVLPQTSRIILCKSNGPRLANASEPIRSGSDLACLLGGVGGRTLGVWWGGGGEWGLLEESELVKSDLASLNIALPKIMCPCSAALLV